MISRRKWFELTALNTLVCITTPAVHPSAGLPRASGNTVQASDDGIERVLAQAMTSSELTIDVRAIGAFVDAFTAVATRLVGRN